MGDPSGQDSIELKGSGGKQGGRRMEGVGVGGHSLTGPSYLNQHCWVWMTWKQRKFTHSRAGKLTGVQPDPIWKWLRAGANEGGSVLRGRMKACFNNYSKKKKATTKKTYRCNSRLQHSLNMISLPSTNSQREKDSERGREREVETSTH